MLILNKPAILLIFMVCVFSNFNIKAAIYNPLDISQAHAHRFETLDLSLDSKSHFRNLKVFIYLPEVQQPAPVILFSHGLGGSRKNNSFMGKHWSRRGYLAVFLQHPGSDDAIWKDLPKKKRLKALKDAAGLKNFMFRAKDVVDVLDQLERWNKQKGHELRGRIDISRVGMSGHSFGAITTQAVSGQQFNVIGQGLTDKRIKAALAFSPSKPAQGDTEEAFAAVKIPWMLMTGTKDLVSIGVQSLSSRLAVYPALPAGGKYELVLYRAEHSAFTDSKLPGDTQDKNPNHHRLILALSTAFWDTWLKEQANAKEWLHGDDAISLLETEDTWQMK